MPGTSYTLAASTRPTNPPDSIVSAHTFNEGSGILTDLAPNTGYYLFVQTCAGDRCSDYGDLGFAATLASVPNLRLDTSDPQAPLLHIQANGNPDGTIFIVEKSEDGGNTFVPIYEGPGREVDLSDLTPGKTFHFRVAAKNIAGQKTSSSDPVLFKSIEYPIDQARAYPVPFRPGQGAEAITFDSFPVGSTIRIYSPLGEQVREITPTENVFEWDVRNQGGSAVSSGVYYVVISGQGGEKKLKIVVQR